VRINVDDIDPQPDPCTDRRRLALLRSSEVVDEIMDEVGLPFEPGVYCPHNTERYAQNSEAACSPGRKVEALIHSFLLSRAGLELFHVLSDGFDVTAAHRNGIKLWHRRGGLLDPGNCLRQIHSVTFSDERRGVAACGVERTSTTVLCAKSV
jgi:hypothetical protein